MQSNRTRLLVEVALAVALAAVLNLLAMRLPFNVAGGSISLTMLPVAVVALRRGAAAGAICGTLFGFIDLLMEPFIVYPTQVLLDYPVPYLLFGLGVGVFAGLYKKFANESTASASGHSPNSKLATAGSATIVVAFIVGGVLRYISHVLSGVIFFAEYAEGQNVWLYSLVYNISYLAPSLVASLVLALILVPILAKVVEPAPA